MKKKTNIADIKFHRYHDSLPENLVKRLKKLYPSVSEILSQSVDEWIDDFCCDMHPEREIKIWENMIELWKSSCKKYKIQSKESKKKVFIMILEHSVGNR